MTSAIHVQNLTKQFHIHERPEGLLPAMRSLIHRQIHTITAVNNISFTIPHGQIVGFLGSNGAGKTTTLKMLAGLLHPTHGRCQVLGYQPHQRHKSFLRQISMIMGQRSQLMWDIPALDSFTLNRAIYRIPNSIYQQTVAELAELLDLTPLLHKPVRNLSLGERMRCEIANALLHQPRILFLDEPTIGLDINAQRRLRNFFREYNQRHRATILLTSHNMADIDNLCERVILIENGRIHSDTPFTHINPIIQQLTEAN